MDTFFQIGYDGSQANQAFAETDAIGSKAAADIEQGFRRAGKATDGFTGFIRQARQEHRLQSFVMREGLAAVNGMSAGMLALTNSMGESGSEMKKFSGAATEGFLAFQGLEFALGALGAGPWGVVAAGIAGISIAWSSLTGENEKAKKEMENMSDEIAKLQHELGIMSNSAYLEKLAGDARKARAALSEFNEEAKNNVSWWQSVKGFFDRMAAGPFGALAPGPVGTPDPAEQQRLILEGLKKQKTEVDESGKTLKTAMEESKKAIEANSKALNDNIELLRAYTKLVAPDLFKKPANKFGDVDEHGNPIWKSDSGPVSFEALSKAMKEIEKMSLESSFAHNLINDFQNIGFSGANAAHLIAGSMQNAASMMTDAFFGASITIGDIFKNLFHDIVQMAIESLFKSLVLKVLGGAIGGGSPAGDSGWNSLNLGKAATVRQRTELAQRVHEAIVKGKAY